jgi:hypothetical protein
VLSDQAMQLMAQPQEGRAFARLQLPARPFEADVDLLDDARTVLYVTSYCTLQ